jgi:hypothetical protein
MPEQILHRSDVVPRLQQVGGERVPQRVRRGLFGDAGLRHSAFERALKGLIEQVMAAKNAAARIGREGGL